MGYVMNAEETGDPELHIEIRSESLILTDDYYPWRENPKKWGERHVFVYGGEMRVFDTKKGPIRAHDSGSVEVTKEWLAKLLKFFDDPKNRERCGIVVPK